MDKEPATFRHKGFGYSIPPEFYIQEGYTWRIKNSFWTSILLFGADTIIKDGRVRKLMPKRLGYGVVEVSLSPIEGI